MNLLLAGAGRHKRARQDAKTNSGPGRRLGPCQVGKKLEDSRTVEENLLGRNFRDFYLNLRWEDSWHKKACGVSQEKNAAGQRKIA